ncbi:MAG: ABC transporter substrate-binding protein [Candidatus Korobacteraceae bacterium]|jgi:branched-chain amino acid transport system substrate-binding protein
MRRFFLIASLLAFVAVGAVAQELTVGVDLSTTGEMAAIGIPQKNGFMIVAPPTIAGLKVKYVYYDDASDPTIAVQNVKRMISEDHIDVLIGPTFTSTSLAVQEALMDGKVPGFAFGQTVSIVTPVDAKRRWVFKTVPNDITFVNAVVNHMLTKTKVRTLGIIAVSDGFGETWINVTQQVAVPKGIKIVGIERYGRADNSCTPQVLRIMKYNPDAILIAASSTAAVTPHLGLIERGYKGKIYQSGGSVNPDFLRLGGKAVEGSFNEQSPFVVAEQLPDGYPFKKGAVDFLKQYEAKYGAGSRASYAAYGGDSIRLIAAAVPTALKKGKPGTFQFREALRDALENSKNVVGLSAVFTMSPTDHTGINELGMCVLRVENGKWKLEQSAAFE